MKKLVLVAVIILMVTGSVFAQVGELQRSQKKTLFVFPIQYGSETEDIPEGMKGWTQSEFISKFVNTFERFDFIDMGVTANVDSFLNDANTYLMNHAQEVVQKQKQPDGRIREVRVTLEDLIAATENGYLFVPYLDEVKKEKQKKKDKPDEITFKVKTHIDIFRTHDKSKVYVAESNEMSFGNLIGAFASMASNLTGGKSEKARTKRAYQSSVNGAYEVMKTAIRKQDEFSLKSVAFDTGFNHFSFDLGENFGVRMDRRYKVWSLDFEGKRTNMEAFGKVRKIKQDNSRAQILIGSVGEGDQVIEDARFGLNIGLMVGFVPWEAEGFDDMGIMVNILDPNVVFDVPKDESGSKANIGLQLEYNTAWFTNISELYVVVEGGFVAVEDAMVWNGLFGVRKKAYFRRIGVFGTLKIGGIGLEFLDTDIFDDTEVEEGDDATVIGVAADIGGEILFTPDLILRGQIGFYGFPKQTVMVGYDLGDGSVKSATVKSAGVTFAITLSYTI
jgi:hypothetical protein